VVFGIQEEGEACKYSVVDDDDHDYYDHDHEVVEDMSNSSCDLVRAVDPWSRASVPDDANKVVVPLQVFRSGDETGQ
jgi:hypothetical protein